MATLGRNIKLTIYNADGTPFHDLALHKFTCDSVVMSLGDKITGDAYYPSNDLVFNMDEYVMYDGVKWMMVNPPTMVREGLANENNELKGMTKYSFTFYHPMYFLAFLPFTDIAVNIGERLYKSQDRNFFWIGNLNDYVAKLNKNLVTTEWIVEVNSSVSLDVRTKMLDEVLPFNDNTVADALKTGYEKFNVPFVVDSIKSGETYYDQGKRFLVSFGNPSKTITISGQEFVFRMGKGVGLKNNSRTPKNNKIITRIAAYGGETNIPYGYPQIEWTGSPSATTTQDGYAIYDGVVGGEIKKLIKHPFTRTHLMPSIYVDCVRRKVNSAASDYDPNITLVDFHDAPSTYPNPINPNAPSYAVHGFDDIKPELGEASIVNAQPINDDMTQASDWDDTIDEEGNYKQGYFKIKLPVMSFDLYACAALTESMKINLRSGACLGCTFEVQVDWDDYKKNFYDKNGNFDPLIGMGHPRDGEKYPNSQVGEINVVLKKDTQTFGTLMPNVYQHPQGGDKFVILGISLPSSYIRNAQQRLDSEMDAYMLENNVYYYEYPLKFDEGFLYKHTSILSQIRNNTIIKFEIANEQKSLYVKQITKKFGDGVLPKYDITLTDDIEVVRNQIGINTDDISRLALAILNLQKSGGAVSLRVEDINKYLQYTLNDRLDEIERQVDHQQITYFGTWMPTLHNKPVTTWTDSIDDHIGDMFYDKNHDKGYELIKQGDTYVWNEISNQHTLDVLRIASNQEDAIDGKRRSFVTDEGVLPLPPYEVGDLWLNATYPNGSRVTDDSIPSYFNDILRCVTTKTKGQTPHIDDWTLSSKYIGKQDVEEMLKANELYLHKKNDDGSQTPDKAEIPIIFEKDVTLEKGFATKNFAHGDDGNGSALVSDTIDEVDEDTLETDHIVARKYVKATGKYDATTQEKTGGKMIAYDGFETEEYRQGAFGAKINREGKAELQDLVIRQFVSSTMFRDGFFGEGFKIWEEDGKWYGTLDGLTVRGTMNVYELLINKIRSIGGHLAISPANGKIKAVEAPGVDHPYSYRIIFESGNDAYQVNDLMRCQRFTGNNIKSYWVEVTNVGTYTDSESGEENQWVDVQVGDDGWYGGSVPQEGDETVQMGNTTNEERQGIIYLHASEDNQGKPMIEILDKVHERNFTGCLRARLGYLGDIVDLENFPQDAQPQGYGLYSDNAYLKGKFILASTNTDVDTMFQIQAGLFKSSMESQQNFLSNGWFRNGMQNWGFGAALFMSGTGSSAKLIGAKKNAVANALQPLSHWDGTDVEGNGYGAPARLIAASLRQGATQMARHPLPVLNYVTDDVYYTTVEEETIEGQTVNVTYYWFEDGTKASKASYDANPSLYAEHEPRVKTREYVKNNGVYVKKYQPVSIRVTIQAKVNVAGTLKMSFANEDTSGASNAQFGGNTGYEFDTTNYPWSSQKLNVNQQLAVTEETQTYDFEALWTGTGDFTMSFTGDMNLYSVVIWSRDEMTYSTSITQTEDFIKFEAESRNEMGKKFDSQFVITSKSITSLVTEVGEQGVAIGQLQVTAGKVESYVGDGTFESAVTQTAQSVDISASKVVISTSGSTKVYLPTTLSTMTIDFNKGDIGGYLNNIGMTWNDLSKAYDKVYGNAYLSDTASVTGGIAGAKTALATAYSSNITSGSEATTGGLTQHHTNIVNAINTYVAATTPTPAQQQAVENNFTYFLNAITRFEGAIRDAEQAIQEYLKNQSDLAYARGSSAIDEYAYLETALPVSNTIISGGLILSKVIALGSGSGAQFTVTSGLSGVYDTTKKGNGIAFWAGGAKKDTEDQDHYSSVSGNYAKSVIRMDGTGYFASGNFTWDANGNVSLTGEVNASSGTIGGITLGNGAWGGATLNQNGIGFSTSYFYLKGDYGYVEMSPYASTSVVGASTCVLKAASTLNNGDAPAIWAVGNSYRGTTADSPRNGYAVYADGKVFISGDLQITGNLSIGGTYPTTTYTFDSNQFTVNNGNVSLKSSFTVSGTITAADFALSSDERKKDVTNDIFMDVDAIAKTRIVNFKYNGKRDNNIHGGVIAQDWINIAPWAITLDECGFYKVSYSPLAMVVGVQCARELVELRAYVKDLERRMGL